MAYLIDRRGEDGIGSDFDGAMILAGIVGWVEAEGRNPSRAARHVMGFAAFNPSRRGSKDASMKFVFMLSHTHGEDDDEREENYKMIGIYSSEDEARAAIARKLQYPGFCDEPDGFEIEKIELNHDMWSEGYITVLLPRKP